MATQNFALSWQLSEAHGWGLVGVHTALWLVDHGQSPILLTAPQMDSLRPENQDKLRPLMDGFLWSQTAAALHPDTTLVLQDTTVLHGLGNGFVSDPATDRFQGTANIGVIAFEDTRFTPDVVARARRFDRLVVHSTYNQTLLTDQGFTNVALAFQGIDPTELTPRPPAGLFGDRFVVFSGGKMEFRKAQDLVLTAFRLFQQRHPDAVLVTAWHSPWPQVASGIAESPHTRVPPDIGPDGALRITDWALRYGIPSHAFVDLGVLSRAQIASVLADCHVGVFPNRCEGGTNLVAMEAMACGVPVILSANTGHLDLIGPDPTNANHCWPLTRQTPLFAPQGNRRGWAESSVEEIVEHLEAIHRDQAEAKARAERARAFLHAERTWSRFAADFIAACTL